MKKEKVKKFVKKHGKVILAGAVTVVVAGTVYAFKKQSGNGFVSMPGFNIEGGLIVGDLGKLGEEYMKHDPALTKDTQVLEVGKLKFD